MVFKASLRRRLSVEAPWRVEASTSLQSSEKSVLKRPEVAPMLALDALVQVEREIDPASGNWT